MLRVIVRFCFSAWGAITLAAGIFALALTTPRPLGPFCLAPLGSLVAFAALVAIAAKSVRRQAAKRLGNPTLRLGGTPRPGEEIIAEISFTPAVALTIGEGGTILLRCLHRVGGRVEPSVHDVQPLAPAVLTPGEPFVLRHTFRIPADARPTLMTPGETATWSIRVDMPLTPGPGWSDRFVVDVLPR